MNVRVASKWLLIVGIFAALLSGSMAAQLGRSPRGEAPSPVRLLELRSDSRASPNVSDRVSIDRATRDPVQVLVSALEAANREVGGKPVPIVVELCDVDLDLTGRSIVIGSDRSLVAAPACAGASEARAGSARAETDWERSASVAVGSNWIKGRIGR